MASFLWGAAGQKMSRQQVAEQNKVARALMQEASDTSPVGHWTAALNRGLQGYLGGRQAYQAREAENAGRSAAMDRFNSRSTANPVAQALAGGATPASYTAPAEASAIRDGLIARGLPDHVADGFIMNFQDESGLNPGINEIAPTVPGSRGGFGLYQLTGDRRNAYEAFAGQRGVDPSDVDAQLDWLMYELQGPEAKAAQSIFASGNAGEAGAAIVNNFLRPAQEHRNSRASRYMGAGAGSYAAPSAGNVSEIAALLGDEWLPESARSVLQAEMNQQMGMQQAAYQAQLQQQDPMRQLEMQRAQLELEQMQQPQQIKPIEVNGQLINPNTFEVIGDYRTIDPSNSERYRAVGGQIWDFAPEGGGAPALVGGGQEEVIYGPDGNPILVRGPQGSGKALTEGQGKDVVYATRAEGALRSLEGLDASALSSRGDRMLDALPLGLGRELQSEEYQQAQNLGNEFLQAILRKDTGAAITEQEQELYGKTYLPAPGDSPAVLEVKKQARARAVEALKAGMDARQVAMTERAIVTAAERSASGDQEQQQQGQFPVGYVDPEYPDFEYVGGDPAKPESWRRK